MHRQLPQINNIAPISQGIHFSAKYLSSSSYCLIYPNSGKTTQVEPLSNNMTATGLFRFAPLRARKVSCPNGY